MLCQFQVNNKVTQLHIYLFVCGYTYIHTHTYSFSDSPPLQVITRYWIQLPVLYSGSLLFLFYTLQCVCVSSVPKSCPTLCNPIDYSPQGIFPSRIRERVVISYSRGSSQPRGQTHVSWVSCIGRQILYHCGTWEALPRQCVYVHPKLLTYLCPFGNHKFVLYICESVLLFCK